MDSYIICPKCQTKVFRDVEGKYFCSKCGKEIKTQSRGWGSE
jgi:uncharacterized Zn finger protein (UPF0148 family)